MNILDLKIFAQKKQQYTYKVFYPEKETEMCNHEKIQIVQDESKEMCLIFTSDFKQAEQVMELLDSVHVWKTQKQTLAIINYDLIATSAKSKEIRFQEQLLDIVSKNIPLDYIPSIDTFLLKLSEKMNSKESLKSYFREKAPLYGRDKIVIKDKLNVQINEDEIEEIYLNSINSLLTKLTIEELNSLNILLKDYILIKTELDLITDLSMGRYLEKNLFVETDNVRIVLTRLSLLEDYWEDDLEFLGEGTFEMLNYYEI